MMGSHYSFKSVGPHIAEGKSSFARLVNAPDKDKHEWAQLMLMNAADYLYRRMQIDGVYPADKGDNDAMGLMDDLRYSMAAEIAQINAERWN